MYIPVLTYVRSVPLFVRLYATCINEDTFCIARRLKVFWTVLQSGRVRDAAWGSDWVGAPVSYQQSIRIVMIVSKEFNLTAGKIIPVSRRTVMVVRETSSGVVDN